MIWLVRWYRRPHFLATELMYCRFHIRYYILFQQYPRFFMINCQLLPAKFAEFQWVKMMDSCSILEQWFCTSYAHPECQLPIHSVSFHFDPFFVHHPVALGGPQVYIVMVRDDAGGQAAAERIFEVRMVSYDWHGVFDNCHFCVYPMISMVSNDPTRFAFLLGIMIWCGKANRFPDLWIFLGVWYYLAHWGMRRVWRVWNWLTGDGLLLGYRHPQYGTYSGYSSTTLDAILWNTDLQLLDQ